ncbi:MAG: hypothetical protein LBK63_08120 [Treponema sp.]|jgi:hypothetical protein|nr:hypothetical protein [Treponema sp.]
MRGKRAAALFFLGCAGGALLHTGCVSLAEAGGRVLDGSAFAEQTLAVYREEPKRGTRVDRLKDRAGQERMVISIDPVPNLRIRCSPPDAEGNFWASSLDFLSLNFSGWNEFSLELSGGGSFVESVSPDGGQRAILQLREPLETLDIKEGKIRRGSARLSGAPALTALRNRRERILVLAQWMEEQSGHSGFSDPADPMGPAEFEAHWKPLLFPELFKPKDRPAAWARADTGAGEWVLGEDIRWSAAYTEALFPEELWPVRNSGTLLRDWEEAAAWIRLEFEWHTIVAFLSGKIGLVKIK